MTDLEEIEQMLLTRYCSPQDEVPVVFILAAPRCGSTLLYQLLLQQFEFCYFSNVTNEHFPTCPVVGGAISVALGQTAAPADFCSNYGKTQGALGPSEASGIFRHWFGGQHPSQIHSAKVLEGKEAHLKRTMTALFAMFGAPVLTKNAWNCFRVEELTRLVPKSLFLWLRRDVRNSAVSDLEARYRHGGPEVWNSATPASIDEIRKRPYWEQVVEQQYAYHACLESDLARFAADRFQALWYESCCDRTAECMAQIADFFSSRGLQARPRGTAIPTLTRSQGPGGRPEDRQRIMAYAESQHHRLEPLLYRGP